MAPMSPEAEGWRRAGAQAERKAPTAESAGLQRRKAHEHVRAAHRQDPEVAGDKKGDRQLFEVRDEK